jgi:ArsR family metal-binding transcriptional regulator
MAIKLYELPNGAFIDPLKIEAVIPRDANKVPGIIEYQPRVTVHYNAGCVEILVCRDMQEARELARKISMEINEATGAKA